MHSVATTLCVVYASQVPNRAVLFTRVNSKHTVALSTNRMLKSLQRLYISKVYAKYSPDMQQVPDSKGLVLVLGWGGSQPNNFNKLRHFYESIGLSTALHIMPLSCPKFVRTSFEAEVEDIVHDHLTKRGIAKGNFIMHLHSQNSIWTFSSLLQRGQMPVPDKVLIDSAPALRYERDPSDEAESLSQLATSLVTGKAVYYLFPFTPIVRALLYVHMHVSALTDRIFPQKFYFFTDYIGLHKYLRDHYPIVPTMFFYSEGDQLIPPHYVDAFRERLMAMGVPVREYLFGPEVSHITAIYKHPKKYLQLAEAFIGVYTKK